MNEMKLLEKSCSNLIDFQNFCHHCLKFGDVITKFIWLDFDTILFRFCPACYKIYVRHEYQPSICKLFFSFSKIQELDVIKHDNC